MRSFAYIVLAAGAATRMGFPKAFAPLAGRSPLGRVTGVLGDRETTVVVPSAELGGAREIAPRARFVTNDAPHRGMAHSLRLGLREIPRDASFGVVLADMPFLSGETLEALERALTDDFDVAYPQGPEGQPGHPVLFSARAREVVEALPEGDTIRLARDDASLRRVVLETSDRGAFLDLDSPAEWRAVSGA